MLRQYHAQRRRGGDNPYGVGTINVGDTFYLQDGVRPMGGLSRHHRIVRREPWMVIAWLNREYHPAVPGRPATTYWAGGHLAIVKSLRTGRECQVADWLLQMHDDEHLDLCREWGEPLPLPKLFRKPEGLCGTSPLHRRKSPSCSRPRNVRKASHRKLSLV